MATASDVDAAAGGSSAEPEALKHLFSYLVNSIDTAALLPAALERGLITARQRSECYNEVDPYKKAETFLGHLERAVNADCNSFHTFVKILQETRQAHIASRLRDELAHSFRSIQQPSTSSSTEEGLECVVPDALVRELASLRIGFAKLKRNCRKQLQNSPEAQKELVEFLPQLFPNMSSSSENSNFQSAFNQFVEEEISLFNTHYLKEICDIFPEDICAATEALVVEYELQLDQFMTSATVSQFKQLFPASAAPFKLLSGKIPVKLKLKNDWGSETIKDLTKLVEYDVLGSHLHLSKIEKGCIAVIWLCSTTEVKQLKMSILKAAGSLQTMGVLQVFIGEEELVLECSQPDSATECMDMEGVTSVSDTFQRVTETDGPAGIQVVDTISTRTVKRSPHPKGSFYKMNKEAAHGTALIINNIKWLPDRNGKPLMPTRNGAKQDGDALKEALMKIRYQVIYGENYTKDEMIQKLKDVRYENIRSDDDSFICCLLSHGGKDGVYGVDKECVSIDDLSKILEPSDTFHKLNHKPKIFFVQACRGTVVSDAIFDADVQAPKPLSVLCGADFFVSYATDPNHIALRHSYPQFLSEELVVPDMNLVDIAMEVHKRLAEQVPIVVEDKRHLQIGQVVHTMRGKVYFQ